MNDTAALFGAPHGPADPETGLPTIELHGPIAEALAAAGWHRDPANIEGEYVEGDWVLNHVGADSVPRAYSIEPSGHHRSLIVHRGPVCDSPVFAINQHSPTPISPAVVLAAVNALIADDQPEAPAEGPTGWGYLDCIARAIHHLPLSRTAQVTPREAADLVLAELTKQGYMIGTEVEDATRDLSAPPPPLGQPCWVTMGGGYGWILAERVDISGTAYWQELRSIGNRTLDVAAWRPLGDRPPALDSMRTAAQLRAIANGMTSQPFDGGSDIIAIADELDPPAPPVNDETAVVWAHPTASYNAGDRVTLGPPGDVKGAGAVVGFVETTTVEILGGYEDVYLVLVDGDSEPTQWGTGWMMAARPEVYLDPHTVAANVDGGRLDGFLIDRAEHDAHADDRPEPQE